MHDPGTFSPSVTGHGTSAIGGACNDLTGRTPLVASDGTLQRGPSDLLPPQFHSLVRGSPPIEFELMQGPVLHRRRKLTKPHSARDRSRSSTPESQPDLSNDAEF